MAGRALARSIHPVKSREATFTRQATNRASRASEGGVIRRLATAFSWREGIGSDAPIGHERTGYKNVGHALEAVALANTRWSSSQSLLVRGR
jgi:hypothetical protein